MKAITTQLNIVVEWFSKNNLKTKFFSFYSSLTILEKNKDCLFKTYFFYYSIIRKVSNLNCCKNNRKYWVRNKNKIKTSKFYLDHCLFLLNYKNKLEKRKYIKIENGNIKKRTRSKINYFEKKTTFCCCCCCWNSFHLKQQISNNNNNDDKKRTRWVLLPLNNKT